MWFLYAIAAVGIILGVFALVDLCDSYLDKPGKVHRDKYDEAMDFLLSYEDEHEFQHVVLKAWGQPFAQPAGCLFQFAVADLAKLPEFNCPHEFGCLTQIRANLPVHPVRYDDNGRATLSYGTSIPCRAENEVVRAEIAADLRIPKSPEGVTRENLYVFAEWRRKLDAMCPAR